MSCPSEETFQHEVRAWTVGELRAALTEVAEDVPVRVEVAEEPGGVFVDLQVVIGASHVPGQGEDQPEEFAISCEYPSGDYLRRRR